MDRSNMSMRTLWVIVILLLPLPVIAQHSPVPSSQAHLSWNVPRNPLFLGQQFKVTLTDSWFGRDKVHHFLTSAFLSGVGYYGLRDEGHYANRAAQSGSLMFSLSLGLTKEIRDGLKSQNAFSVKDLVADVLGALLGLAIVADL